MIINCDNLPSSIQHVATFSYLCTEMHGKRIYENNIQEMDHINSELTTDCPADSLYFRYVDIVLGLSFLVSHLILMHSSKHESRPHLTLYFVFSVSTLILYWAWFIYLKYAMGENEASKEVNMW